MTKTNNAISKYFKATWANILKNNLISKEAKLSLLKDQLEIYRKFSVEQRLIDPQEASTIVDEAMAYMKQYVSS